jgi:hypothetical protein
LSARRVKLACFIGAISTGPEEVEIVSAALAKSAVAAVTTHRKQIEANLITEILLRQPINIYRDSLFVYD